VAKRLGVSKKVISQIENNKPITEKFSGDLFTALSYIYQVPYCYLTKGVHEEGYVMTLESILEYITDHQLLSWKAKGVLFHILWKEDMEPSFNTIRQFSGDNYDRTQSALDELLYYDMIFKYKSLGDIEVYGFNYLVVCDSVRTRKIMSKINK
jgi:DNA-binding XRE family transcriptional regulator